jgi:hypothetical protein
MSIICIKCKEEIHPRRIKALPNTKVCIKCSTEGTYKAITTVNGEGDHTWNDIHLITDEEHQILEQNISKAKPIKFDEWATNDDDRNLQGPFIILEED